MTKRMLTFISDQTLPTFIPVNESGSRPDVIRAVNPVTDKGMERTRSSQRLQEGTI